MTSVLELVNANSFSKLFREKLGWNRSDIRKAISLSIDGGDYRVDPVASYKGIRVWSVSEVPGRRVQRLIDVELRRTSQEHLIIFFDSKSQEWRWPQTSDSPGNSLPKLTTHLHTIGRSNEALCQRLNMIKIGFSETPSVPDVLKRLRTAFNADKVTKSFYKEFLREYNDLVSAIDGLDVEGDRHWYSALLMNRLMFIYFMQRKGFMNSDRDYLRTCLNRISTLESDSENANYYRRFLIPLFHNALGSPRIDKCDPAVRSIIGDVPYINGGIFSLHEIEINNRNISVPNQTFADIFQLFDSYQWHLDDSPTGNSNEINPDVLGYIFEQFINQKDTGAYYTKDDVTRFMTSSSLLPVFLQRMEKSIGIGPWQMLANEPKRFIWDSWFYGDSSHDIHLPPENQPSTSEPEFDPGSASESARLPSESSIESDYRYRFAESLVEDIKRGAVGDVNSAVTKNIDLESLSLAYIDRLEDGESVLKAWDILSSLKVVDPTCGSGAFLFSALRILQSLYDAVLDAARVVFAAAPATEIGRLLETVDAHPSPEYFILKQITLNNIYGVDIMKEAVEIARLRMFLKLMSAVDERSDIEPLPDLDFNIKPGNILVGAHSAEEIRSTSDLFADLVIEEVLNSAELVSSSYEEFRRLQVNGSAAEVDEARAKLSSNLSSARSKVDSHFHSVKGIRLSLTEWVRTHQPFHWFIEFPEVFSQGGFDVLIGNPPYIRRSHVKSYSFDGFSTSNSPDIYAACCERSAQIVSPCGRLALIVPISSQFADDYKDLRDVLSARFSTIWASTFDRRPSSLFQGNVGVRSTIIITAGASELENLYVTTTHRWAKDYRQYLFELIRYTESFGSPLSSDHWMRLPSNEVRLLFETLLKKSPLRLGHSFSKSGNWKVGFKGNALYWLSAFVEAPPVILPDGSTSEQSMMSWVRTRSRDEQMATLAVCLSKIALGWWHLTGDNLNVTKKSIESIPVDLSVLPRSVFEELVTIGEVLEAELPATLRSTLYRQRLTFNYHIPSLRPITDRVDRLLADWAGVAKYLPDLEHLYYSLFKGGDVEADI